MSNIFQEVLNNAQGVEEKLLGPSYPYYKNIKTPSQIGMSSKGTIQQMSQNIVGLTNYVEVLVSGTSSASATGGPLGNKFFLQTGGKCVDNSVDGSNNQVDRYIYVNNVPEGNIPFISSGLGVDFTDFRGLIPGAMSNLNVLNPFGLLQSFLAGSTPPCQEITMQTIDINNNKSSATHFVTVADIQNMDPCNFPNKKNPVTKAQCRETFKTPVEPELKLPDDFLAQLFIGSLCIIIIYTIITKLK